MKALFSYYGGKSRMLPHIRPLIPSQSLYCEPFAGSAAVFFDKTPAVVNVINDLNGELINFYRVTANHPAELRKMVSGTLHCRKQFEHAWHVYNHADFFTPIERAWAVFCLAKLGFAGKIANDFGFDKSEARKPRKIANAIELFTEELSDLLRKTTIECDDAFVIIRRYDTETSWFFVDPPYIGSDMGHYAGMFNEQNLSDLLALLASLHGKFLLTMYPNTAIEAAATQHGWTIHKVDRRITASRTGRRKQEEWMVTNY